MAFPYAPVSSFRFGFRIDERAGEQSDCQQQQPQLPSHGDDGCCDAPAPVDVAALIAAARLDVSAALQPLLTAASLPPAIRVQLRSDFCPLRQELPLAAAGSGSELSAVLSRRDVQRGVYEGGFKLWECAVDLIDFLSSAPSPLPHSSFRSVLELGCGAGFPGLYCLLRRCGSGPSQAEQSRLTFQDLNWEVLQHLTAPTVAVNLQLQDGAAPSSPSSPSLP